VENRPLEKLVLPVRKSLRWRLPGDSGRVVAWGGEALRSRQDARCLRAYTPGPARGHRASAPAHAAARGRLAPPLARDGKRPAKKQPSSRSPPLCDNSVGLAWAEITTFLCDGECRVGNPSEAAGRLLTATPLHLKGQKIADYMRRLD